MLSDNVNPGTSSAATAVDIKSTPGDYGRILSAQGFKFFRSGCYLQVGSIDWVQGWMFDISVVMSEIASLLQRVLPVFARYGLAFKVVADPETARNMLDGHLGYHQLGKLIIVYPDEFADLSSISADLIRTTSEFKSPKIPTDKHLGGCIYTRYGGCAPLQVVTASGEKLECIYGPDHRMIPDPFTIPFTLPSGLIWPFGQFVSKDICNGQKSTIKGCYRPVAILKADARGRVMKAVYLKGIIRTGTCVIKEGKSYMCSDEYGRDIQDRLEWQDYLHKNLPRSIPIPKIIDVFEENGDSYLVMEYIKGESLFEIRQKLNPDCLCWPELPPARQILIVEYFSRIVEIVGELHKSGYVHRDITPANFMIDENGEIKLIDIELAYSLGQRRPSPPFAFGSPGYISPEQARLAVPTVKEDLYALGAMMIYLFVGLTPNFFSAGVSDHLEDRIFFFLQDRGLSKIISEGISENPEERPELDLVALAIAELTRRYRLKSKSVNTRFVNLPPKSTIDEFIADILRSISSKTILQKDGVWMTKSSDAQSQIGNRQMTYSINSGMVDGVAGILYVLSKAKIIGYSIEPCIEAYRKSFEYLFGGYLNRLQCIPPGLFNGGAGVAIALNSAREAGLIDGSAALPAMEKCFSERPTVISLNEGAAGQGSACIVAKLGLNYSFYEVTLGRCIKKLQDQQRRDGSWLLSPESKDKKANADLSFSSGMAGVTWFSLQSLQVVNSEVTFRMARSALDCFNKRIRKYNRTQNRRNNNAFKAQWSAQSILVYIKAFEVLRESKYRDFATDALLANPPFPVYENLSQFAGFLGLGELYLEAWRVFKEDRWFERATWVLSAMQNLRQVSKDGACFWMPPDGSHPTADFRNGMSGILHFALRYRYPEIVQYPIIA